MSSLFRFYKNNEESLDSLKTPFLYLASAEKWKPDGEFDFDIDIGTDEEYMRFLQRKLTEGFSLKQGDEDFEDFHHQRMEKLKEYGKLDLYGEIGEYVFLYDILFFEARTTEGIQKRTKSMRDNYFNRTGISCFTMHPESMVDYFFWNRFAGFGSGFCVEYDSSLLQKYFVENDIKVAGKEIVYLTTKPILKFPQKDLSEIKSSFENVIFSLKQSLDEEKEFRLATIYREDVPAIDERRKIIIPQNIIKSVTIGYGVGKANEELIKEIVAKNINCKQLYKINEQYDLLHRFKI